MRVGSLSTLPSEILRVWNRLPRGQKIVLLALGATAIMLFVLFTSWSRSPDFVPLYTRLDPSDGAAIVDQLQTQGTAYEVADGGSTIRVPSTQVAEVRLNLATLGLPTGGGVGFEVFDKQSFGVTDFVQRINLRRSLEGELTRTITQLDGVRGARVHLAIPEEQLFTDQQPDTTASVVLDIQPGRALSVAQVRGVAHLVAQSVEGLDAKNITILNTKGDILYDGTDNLEIAGSTQLELTHAFDQQVERDLGVFLRSVLGPNKSAVQVSAVLDFTQAATTTEIYTPVQNGTRSTQTVTETFTGSGNAADLAVPGAVANIPGVNAPQTNTPEGTNTSDYSRNESTTNNELNKTQQTINTAPGEVKNLSISVLLDESIPEEQATALKDAIAAAAGISSDRGDTIAVTRIPFDTTELEAAKAALAQEAAADKQANMLRLAIPIVAVVLAGGLFFLLLRKVNKARAAHAAELAQYSLAIGMGPGGALPPGNNAAALEAQLRDVNQRQRTETNKQISTFARAQPRAVAEVVQTWMQEET